MKDSMESIEVITQKAEQGNVKAMFDLANCYYQGINGVQMHYAKAMNWFEKVAEDGSERELAAKACHHLMNYYLKSEIEKAEKWAKKEAQYGSQEGMIVYATYICEADEFCESPNKRAEGYRLLKEFTSREKGEKYDNGKLRKHETKFFKENFAWILFYKAIAYLYYHTVYRYLIIFFLYILFISKTHYTTILI